MHTQQVTIVQGDSRYNTASKTTGTKKKGGVDPLGGEVRPLLATGRGFKSYSFLYVGYNGKGASNNTVVIGYSGA